jgi:hypothetical protein
MGADGVSQRKLTPGEAQFLRKSLSEDYKVTGIRLREGEYQYSLAKAIASFQLELRFPDVRELARRLYGEERANDIQFIRKIQTILKKMEKSGIIEILAKRRPWDLQRYALSSFKFQDSDKNRVILATEQEIKQAYGLLQSTLNQQEGFASRKLTGIVKSAILSLIVLVSYGAILWGLLQPVINPVVFIPAFSVAVACSVLLGKALSEI